MLNIQKKIEQIPEDRVALASNGIRYLYRDIKCLISKNKKQLNNLKGSAVVIKGRERLEFALLLSILDGNVSKILFLPSDIDDDLHKQYYEEVGINYEVYLDNDILKYNSININTIENMNEEYSSEWIIPTSGTTNIPKLVSHTFNSLTRTTISNIDKGKDFKWGLVFDIYRFSGIQVFLQSILSGSTLIITNPTDSMTKILTDLKVEQCNALSATPSFWRKVLMTTESEKLNFQRITLGGEISDKNILNALRQKYPKAKISHIYASTEVGVGFSVSDGKEGFPLSYLDEYNMKIDKEGLLWISPPNKNQKYISNDKMYDKDGYINTGDLVRVDNGRVYFLGRDSGAINVGGNKVQPEEVEMILLATNKLNSAYVYAIKNPMMGSLVCADVVLKDEDENIDNKQIKSELIKYCREHLESFKVPAIIKFVKEIKTTSSGKLKRG